MDLKKISDYIPSNRNDKEIFQKTGKECVREFLQMEMEISERVATDLRNKNVFYPKAGVATWMIYADFHSEEELISVKKYAKSLQTTNWFKP